MGTSEIMLGGNLVMDDTISDDDDDNNHNMFNQGKPLGKSCYKVAHNSLVRIRHVRVRCSIAAIPTIFRKIF